MAKTLALFDFDGTITTKDTFLELLKYDQGKWKFYTGMFTMLPHIAFYITGLIKAQILKEKVINYFWKNIDEKEFIKLCLDFNDHILPSLLRPKAIEQLKYHLSNGDDVAVVSASAENWITPFCEIYSIKCIGSILEKKEGRLTGKLKGKNCKGEEKVSRVKAAFRINEYDNIIVYGDSKGDKHLLELASSAYYKPFRK